MISGAEVESLKWKNALITRIEPMRSKMLKSHVSVIVPAYNAEQTLDETLSSLQAQTFPNWETIIVDDGSTDNTATIASRWVQQDARFRLVHQANCGRSAARNTGIREARYEWLVFLDSDDWLAPEYLELMIRKVTADKRLNAVVCGCVRVTPSGKHGTPTLYKSSHLVDPFPDFARDCPFAIHNCMVKHSLIESIGVFDTSLVNCQDWDFWQRVARAGTCFGMVTEVLAFYRMRPGSASTNAERILIDGLNVIRRGHSRDPRVLKPDPRYANGLPAEELPGALFRHALWPASIMLAQGKDARPLLRLMGELRDPSLDPKLVAKCLFEFVPFASSGTTLDWIEVWPTIAERLILYLVALEAKSGAKGIAQLSVQHLEYLIIKMAYIKHPLTIGSTHGVRINIDNPIVDIVVPKGVNQLFCMVDAGGQYIGSINLPALSNIVDKKVIVKSILSDLSWSLILWRFHLNLPPDSQLRKRLFRLMHEKRSLSRISQLAGIIWQLFRWQANEGFLRKSPVLIRLLKLMWKMQFIHLFCLLVCTRHDSRRNLLKKFLKNMAQQFVNEEGLVTAISTEMPVRK